MSAVSKGAHAPAFVATEWDRQSTIVCIGPAHRLPDCYVRTISSEIEGSNVVRFDTLATYLAHSQRARDAVRLVLIDAQLAPELAALPDRAMSVLTGSTLAVAYRDAVAIEPVLSRLIDCGVRGFVPLHESLEVLLSIIRLMVSGGSYIPAELVAPAAPREVAGPNDPGSGLEETLTPRQAEVLRLVARGRQNKLIADELGLSQHTVKLHIHHIIRKLGVNNRTEAAAWYHARATS